MRIVLSSHARVARRPQGRCRIGQMLTYTYPRPAVARIAAFALKHGTQDSVARGFMFHRYRWRRVQHALRRSSPFVPRAGIRQAGSQSIRRGAKVAPETPFLCVGCGTAVSAYLPIGWGRAVLPEIPVRDMLATEAVPATLYHHKFPAFVGDPPSLHGSRI